MQRKHVLKFFEHNYQKKRRSKGIPTQTIEERYLLSGLQGERRNGIASLLTGTMAYFSDQIAKEDLLYLSHVTWYRQGKSNHHSPDDCSLPLRCSRSIGRLISYPVRGHVTRITDQKVRSSIFFLFRYIINLAIHLYICQCNGYVEVDKEISAYVSDFVILHRLLGFFLCFYYVEFEFERISRKCHVNELTISIF